MAGEAKRDFPASIGYQSPWYKEYPLIENYFARLNKALRRGTPHVRLGVIHPIESYWPVSYTHLDVYKRQPETATQSLSVLISVPVSTNGAEPQPKKPDVYKRQPDG